MKGIENLKAENERLKAENNSLFEQFARWAYNAHSKVLDEAFLNRPLVPTLVLQSCWTNHGLDHLLQGFLTLSGGYWEIKKFG